MLKHLTLILFFLLSTVVLAQVRPTRNSILVIKPYKYHGTWVFDDERVRLSREPFISGVPEIIDKMVAHIPNADKGFRLLFSSQDFPGVTNKFIHRRAEKRGNWYYSPDYKQEGWLCPALFKYFYSTPKTIYVRVEPLKTPKTANKK